MTSIRHFYCILQIYYIFRIKSYHSIFKNLILICWLLNPSFLLLIYLRVVCSSDWCEKGTCNYSPGSTSFQTQEMRNVALHKDMPGKI